MDKKYKKKVDIYQTKVGKERRQEMLDEIKKGDTFFPESVMHEDLDKGMLEFVKNNLEVKHGDSSIPVNKIIYTIQRWAEYTQTWFNTDAEGNVQLPFITVIRKPDPQPGTHPALQYTIPDKRTFTYATVPTWDGNQYGKDIYKIPQPVPIDISYDVVIVCDKTRILNKFNKVVLQKFASRQSYTKVKGHYIPIILDSIVDESPFDNLEGRRYYQQVYNFRLEGFLLDENDFEVKPAINRIVVTTDIKKDEDKSSVIYTKNAEIVTTTIKSDGIKTIFSVGEKIGILIGVSKNGITQQRDVVYNHHDGTSNIIFNIPPENGTVINIIYISQRSIKVNINNEKLTYNLEKIISDGSPSFMIQQQVEIVYVTKNETTLGVSDYSYNENTGELTITSASGDVISVHTLY